MMAPDFAPLYPGYQTVAFLILPVTQDCTGDSVSYFAGPAAAAFPVQDVVQFVIECLAYGQWTGCRLFTVQVGAG